MLFLEKLYESESLEEDSHIAVVVAHQDDESIGFGGQLSRMPNCLMVHVTDGSPADPREWRDRGFKDRQEYAEIRRREVTDALNIVGHAGPRESFAIADQEVCFELSESTQRLVDMFLKHDIRYVLTHAYEGGHPDHDAVAFAAHAAKKILALRGVQLSLIEAPFFRPEGEDSIKQSFVPTQQVATFSYHLRPAQQEQKRKMFDAHATQRSTFAKMSTAQEWLREAPDYDFRDFPNSGTLSRIYKESGMQNRWTTLSQRALTQLGL